VTAARCTWAVAAVAIVGGRGLLKVIPLTGITPDRRRHHAHPGRHQPIGRPQLTPAPLGLLRIKEWSGPVRSPLGLRVVPVVSSLVSVIVSVISGCMGMVLALSWDVASMAHGLPPGPAP